MPDDPNPKEIWQIPPAEMFAVPQRIEEPKPVAPAAPLPKTSLMKSKMVITLSILIIVVVLVYAVWFFFIRGLILQF